MGAVIEMHSRVFYTLAAESASCVLRAGSLGMSANCVKISDVSAACTFT